MKTTIRNLQDLTTVKFRRYSIGDFVGWEKWQTGVLYVSDRLRKTLTGKKFEHLKYNQAGDPCLLLLKNEVTSFEFHPPNCTTTPEGLQAKNEQGTFQIEGVTLDY